MSSIQKLLQKASSLLSGSSPSPTLDAEVLLMHALGKDKAFLYTHPEYTPKTKTQRKFQELVLRRKAHEPIAYIICKKEFFGLNFFVNKNVLIPRPLTETLCELALKEKSDTCVDVGTGSGCIIITLAKKIFNKIDRWKKRQFYAADISKKALYVARKNARFHNVQNMITFFHANLLPKKNIFKNAKDITITANLPYIPQSLYKDLSPDIRQYEPKKALLAKQDGLFLYRKLLAGIRPSVETMHPDAKVVLLFEILPQQKKALAKLVKNIFPDSCISFPHPCIARIQK